MIEKGTVLGATDTKNTLASFLPAGTRHEQVGGSIEVATFQATMLQQAGYAVIYLGEPE